MRTLGFYLTAIAIVTVYGVEVCPFLDALAPIDLGLLALVGAGTAWSARWLLRRQLMVDRPVFERARWCFWSELGAIVAAGLVAGAMTMIVWGFPVGSLVKQLLGYLTLGLFTALALSLDEEHAVMAANPVPPNRAPGGVRSFARRFMAAALLLAIMVAGILILIIWHDLQWLASLPAADWAAARRLVLIEVVFVIGIFAGYVALLSVLFARNLRLFLDLELDIMEAVSRGSYERRVPVGSETEFGHIAWHTNMMIDGLRERDRIRTVFGKMVSPTLSRRLLDESMGLVDGGGRRHRAVILFSDLRDFTRRTERSKPEALVRELNLYFERMVQVIHAEDGVVDKFIGDGIMAVFGLVDEDSAPDRAVRAAIAMQAALDALQPHFDPPLRMGIGVHAGEVIAGTIGAPERLEFTVIGDPVNTAARLEARTKALEVDILVSDAVHARLSPELKAVGWRHLGQQQLKGKQRVVDVYGR